MAPPQASASPGGLQVARLFGIPLVLHGSWLLSLGLLSLVANETVVPSLVHDAAPAVELILSVFFGLVIASCIVIHELAHCVVARAYGLPVRRIMLFMFGGVSQIEREAPGPAAEYYIAVAGPLSSLMLGTGMALIARMMNPGTDFLLGAWGGIAYVNVVLAIFNLVPAFPMDGGRILRSGLWGAVRNRARATRWAVWVGRVLAAGMIAFGAFSLLMGIIRDDQDALSSAWTILVGFFIFQAAGQAGTVEGSNNPNPTTTGIEPPSVRRLR